MWFGWVRGVERCWVGVEGCFRGRWGGRVRVRVGDRSVDSASGRNLGGVG